MGNHSKTPFFLFPKSTPLFFVVIDDRVNRQNFGGPNEHKNSELETIYYNQFIKLTR